MATKNGQLERVRCIHCLLCNVSKPFNGFLSHIRQKHLNYHRYKCTKCTFKSDNEEDSTLHSFEKNHHVKFDDVNYQEHLAVKIFQDCCRKQFAIRDGTEKEECDNSGQTKRKGSWNSYSDIQKIHNPKKSKIKTNDACLSNFLKDEVNLQTISENQKDYGISPNSTKCVYDEEKSESGIHNIKILSKAASSDSEPSKLSKPDDETFNALELFSDALQDTKTSSPDNLPNVDTVDVVPIDRKARRSNRDTFDRKEEVVENTSVLQTIRPQLNIACYKCGKEVDASYTAKKTHALQFHFTQDDDPEIAELLPATIRACFPHSLAWSDYQCTECGKALGTYSSRRNHVLREHFYWSTICPFSGCTAVINALGALEEHFKFEHNILKLEMPKGLKHTLKKIENNRKNDLHRQLNHCFPCSIPPKKQVIYKESTYESRHLPKPSITSVLSSLLHSQSINHAKKKNFAYSSSDDESSSIEDEDNSGIKDKKHGIMNQKGEPVKRNISAECSRNVNDSDSNITCHNFYNQEKLNIVPDKERYCTICHSRYFETNE